ncbi:MULTISPECIES: Trp biosynthesis-associated membrane protein [Mumia]|uniref:Trp biosynthesis-associated membrane protein n=1 Tax=Mumia TaxID=1546255 RepID=UPI0013D850C1|nr:MULTISPECIES: Trp biosynthesis-associated membrane protein [Mumia]
MTSRGYGTTVLLGVAGAGAAFFAASQPWARVTVETQGLARDAVAVSGNDALPVVGGLALVALAGSVAVLATAGRIRTAVGVIVTLASLGAMIAVLTGSDALHDALVVSLADSPAMSGDAALQESLADDATGTMWRWATLVALALPALAGLAVVRWGREWPSMGRRYDSVGQQKAETDDDPWKALDRGEDPTV